MYIYYHTHMISQVIGFVDVNVTDQAFGANNIISNQPF